MGNKKNKRGRSGGGGGGKKRARRSGASVASHRAQLPKILRTVKEQNAKKGGVARGKSIVSTKNGGNYSMDPKWKMSDKRVYLPNGKRNPDYTIGDFLATAALPSNLNIIKKEVAHMKKKKSLSTSPSFHGAIEIAFFYKKTEGTGYVDRKEEDDEEEDSK